MSRMKDRVENGDSEAEERSESKPSDKHYATGEVIRRPEPSSSKWRKVVRIIGWTFIAAGLVLLEFAAYLVWGTNQQTARAQKRLKEEFASATSPASSGAGRGSKEATKEIQPEIGRPIARLVIPSLGVDAIVVEGVGHEELKLGPGHIPETALPGRRGSSVISGHRTTYGAPFGDIDRLPEGAEILVFTVEGESRYVVTRSFVVLPDDTSVIAPLKPGDRPRLRLTTCHPKFSAAKRLVVEADLVTEPTR